MEKVNGKLQLHKFIKFVLVVTILWAHPLKSDVPHDILAQMTQASYRLHQAPRKLPAWQIAPIEDEDHTYGAIFYPKAAGRNEAVIALRGTYATTDWLTNFMYGLTVCRGCGVGKDLYAHKGYYIRAKRILPFLNQAIKDSRLQDYTFSFAGHSKGGAVVSILSLLYKAGAPKSSYGSLVTFGAPYTGNTATVLQINKLFGNRQAHYSLDSDIVPMVVPLAGMLTSALVIDEGQGGKMYAPYSHSELLASPIGSEENSEALDSDNFVDVANALAGEMRHSMKVYLTALQASKEK